MPQDSRKGWTRGQWAACIDHSLLAATTTPTEVRQLCAEARDEGFAAVCINGAHTSLAVQELSGSGIPVAVTVGFPLGACSTETKLFEARHALEQGARELDVVLPLGALRAGDDDLVSSELEALAQLSRAHDALLKVILETCLLEATEKLRAIQLALEAGANMLKTSTGFSTGGARVDDVILMRAHAPPGIGIKAAGGIGSLAQADAMLEAGATRLGCSRSLAILDELGP